MKVNVRRRAAVGALCLTTLLVVTGCATSSLPHGNVSTVQTGPWSGRLSLTVQSEPPQHFSAGFALQGDADTGDLTLTSPLGNIVAMLRWQPGRVELDRGGGQVQTFASLDELTARTTGAVVPMHALFGWLRGQDAVSDGWQADLSALAQGRLTARRIAPTPTVELRIALDR